MTAPNPLPWPSDAYWCPTCQIHRTTNPVRDCPVCVDLAKQESQR